jgi:hypothetical protein
MTMIAYAFLQHRRLAKARRGKKESTGRHLNQACQPCATPSSSSSFDCRLSDARTAEDGSMRHSGMSKSAKVVLGRGLINSRPMSAFGQADIVRLWR